MHSHVRRGLTAAVALTVALLSAACTSSGSKGSSAGSSSANVTLSEFTIVPGTIDVSAGATATLHVTNQGQVPHQLAVDAGGTTVHTSILQTGMSEDLTLPALPAGSYSAWCSVPGHKEAGMTALIRAGGTATEAGSMPGMSSGGAAGMSSMSAQQMADAHKSSTKAFPAKTEGLGGQALKPTIVDGVKVFDLVAQQVSWEVSPGVFRDALTYNGAVPGPELRVRRGEKIRVVLENQLAQPTVIHFHGMTVPNAMDGVPYITQDPVMPGASFQYEFTVKDPPGTYMYHSHFNSDEQVGRGLYGAIVVEPEQATWDEEYTEILGDGPLGFTINGKSFPATTPLTAKLDDTVRVRVSNLGNMIHPLHLHGYHFTVLEQDGQTLTDPDVVDTLMVAPGQTYDLEVKATHPGAWAFHCHILSHVEGPQGMFGMVTALVVT
jgi:FtsP/CotA-like multicopper oxidase with cupredoxin domain